MPRIVGIHGIGHQYGGASTLRSEWLPAIQDGLAAAGHRTLADKVTGRDLNVAFFGDLFRPLGSLAMNSIPYTANDLTSPAEIALVEDLYQAAVDQEPSLAPAEATLGPLLVGIQVIRTPPAIAHLRQDPRTRIRRESEAGRALSWRSRR